MDTMQPELKNNSQAVWHSMRAGVLVSLAVVIVFFIGLVYILNRNNAPMNIIVSPTSYPAGTQIETYKDLPNEFPKDILMAGNTLEHADIVRHADQSYIVTAIYNVAQPLPVAMSGELDVLKKAGWQVSGSKIDSNSGFISAATDPTDSVVITFTIDGTGSDASFQFSGIKA